MERHPEGGQLMAAIAAGARPGVAPATHASGATFSQAASIDDVFEALAAGARIVAGGTDLVVGTRQGKWKMPAHLVAIDRVEDLRGIRPTHAGGLSLGALTTHDDLATNALIRERWAALSDAAAIVGSFATRHVGTIGGNIVNASPAAETVGPLICFGAVAVIRSSSGERRAAVADIATGPGRTSLHAGELVVAVELPAPAKGTASCYARLEYRRQMEIAVVGTTVVVTISGGRASDARIAITALAPTIHRVAEAEAALNGSDGGHQAAERAAQAAAHAARPIDDVRAPAEYRRAMAAVITRRVITAAVDRAHGRGPGIPASDALHGAR
jgi:CO/xanthine dehydrogenase FAD-binding subunit